MSSTIIHGTSNINDSSNGNNSDNEGAWSSERLEDAERELEQQIDLLKVTLATVLLPTLARFAGRRLASKFFPHLLEKWLPAAF